jgi:tetratricopeptide (TPR) repeat protein
MLRFNYIQALSVTLISAISAVALGQQTQPPPPAPAVAPTSATSSSDKAPAKDLPAVKSEQKSEQSESPGARGIPEKGSAWISPEPATTSAAPLAYPTTRSESSANVEDLIRTAATLTRQGNLSKAMELNNEALAIAPLYAAAYRQRALTLSRLGDRVKAQIDYNRFLELDPQAQTKLREEIQLFKDSGYARIGEAEGLPNGVIRPGEIYGSYVESRALQAPTSPALLSDKYYSIAQDDFMRGKYSNAMQWAQRAQELMPQARIHAIKAQALFAQGFYSGAASEARAASAMGPLIDWSTLYGYYNYNMPMFSKQFKSLQEFVRQNPSSSDARYLLGYQHLILGQEELGHAQMAIAAVLEPIDVVPTSMLARDGVEIVQGQRQLTENMPRQEGVGITDRTERIATRPTPPPAPSPANSTERIEVK